MAVSVPASATTMMARAPQTIAKVQMESVPLVNTLAALVVPHVGILRSGTAMPMAAMGSTRRRLASVLVLLRH